MKTKGHLDAERGLQMKLASTRYRGRVNQPRQPGVFARFSLDPWLMAEMPPAFNA